MFFFGAGLMETILLIANSLAIINEEWILKKCIFNKMVGINLNFKKKLVFNKLNLNLYLFYILCEIMGDTY